MHEKEETESETLVVGSINPWRLFESIIRAGVSLRVIGHFHLLKNPAAALTQIFQFHFVFKMATPRVLISAFRMPVKGVAEDIEFGSCER